MVAGSLPRGFIQTKALLRPQSLHPKAPDPRKLSVLKKQSLRQDPNNLISDLRALFSPRNQSNK